MTAEFAIQVCGWLFGVPLEFLLVAALLRGEFKRFPFLFAYATVGLLTTLVEIPAKINAVMYPADKLLVRHFATIYWINEVILQAFMLAVVVSLMDRAATHLRSRRLARAVLVLGALLFAGTSFAVHHTPGMHILGLWMTDWTRDMNFGSAILDLLLWMMLLSSGRGDRRLLLISGALGLQFTGEAIGGAVRSLSIAQTVNSLQLAGSIIAMLADNACLYIWWRTFRPAPAVGGQAAQAPGEGVG